MTVDVIKELVCSIVCFGNNW